MKKPMPPKGPTRIKTTPEVEASAQEAVNKLMEFLTYHKEYDFFGNGFKPDTFAIVLGDSKKNLSLKIPFPIVCEEEVH
jgi:hypothetical protein